MGEDPNVEELLVGLEYLACWLSGSGCVPINHLMEDAATAEISRAQVWQWIRHPAGILPDGRNITRELVQEVLYQELVSVSEKLGETHKQSVEIAAQILDELITREDFVDFLTLPAYDHLDQSNKEGDDRG